MLKVPNVSIKDAHPFLPHRKKNPLPVYLLFILNEIPLSLLQSVIENKQAFDWEI